MTAEEPKVQMNGRYSTKEACELLSVARNTLLNWRRENKIKCGNRRTNGRAFYYGHELVRVWKSQW